MTITKYDKFFNIIPKRCSKCGRLFIFEPYNIYYKEIGFGYYDQIKCKICSSAHWATFYGSKPEEIYKRCSICGHE